MAGEVPTPPQPLQMGSAPKAGFFQAGLYPPFPTTAGTLNNLIGQVWPRGRN
jgi:hypothetical protein